MKNSRTGPLTSGSSAGAQFCGKARSPLASANPPHTRQIRPRTASPMRLARPVLIAAPSS
ncbi:hypothetical protein [Nonomuraea dietziae]|uniref:hypothetical protein n=1 Tax=Nonomuraea dietziae TaxID=65515 RepID=UPI0031D9F289